MATEPGWLQRFFEFYATFFGITPPPPARQKLVLAMLVSFFVALAVGLVVIARVVSRF